MPLLPHLHYDDKVACGVGGQVQRCLAQSWQEVCFMVNWAIDSCQEEPWKPGTGLCIGTPWDIAKVQF